MKPLKLYEQFVFEEAIKNANEIISKLTGYNRIKSDEPTFLVKSLTLGRIYIELDKQKAIMFGGQVAAFTTANDPALATKLLSLPGAKRALKPEGQISDKDGKTVNYYNWTVYNLGTDKTDDLVKFITNLETLLTKGELPTEKTSTFKSVGDYVEGDIVFLKNGESVKIVGYDLTKKEYLVKKLTDAENVVPQRVPKDSIDRKDYAAALLGSDFISAYRSALASVYGGSGGLDTSKEREKADLGISDEVNKKFMVDPEGAKIVKELEAITRRAKAENRNIDSYPEKAQLSARAKTVQDRIIAEVIKSKQKPEA